MQSMNSDMLHKSRNRFSMVHRNDILIVKSCYITMVNYILVLRLGDVACFTVAFGEINARLITYF